MSFLTTIAKEAIVLCVIPTSASRILTSTTDISIFNRPPSKLCSGDPSFDRIIIMRYDKSSKRRAVVGHQEGRQVEFFDGAVFDALTNGRNVAMFEVLVARGRGWQEDA